MQSLADKALASFIIIQAALKRSERLSTYTKREDLNKRMPNFQAGHHALKQSVFKWLLMVCR